MGNAGIIAELLGDGLSQFAGGSLAHARVGQGNPDPRPTRSGEDGLRELLEIDSFHGWRLEHNANIGNEQSYARSLAMIPEMSLVHALSCLCLALQAGIRLPACRNGGPILLRRIGRGRRPVGSTVMRPWNWCPLQAWTLAWLQDWAEFTPL